MWVVVFVTVGIVSVLKCCVVLVAVAVLRCWAVSPCVVKEPPKGFLLRLCLGWMEVAFDWSGHLEGGIGPPQ